MNFKVKARHRHQILLSLHSECSRYTPQWVFQLSADAISQNIQPCSILMESLYYDYTNYSGFFAVWSIIDAISQNISKNQHYSRSWFSLQYSLTINHFNHKHLRTPLMMSWALIWIRGYHCFDYQRVSAAARRSVCRYLLIPNQNS